VSGSSRPPGSDDPESGKEAKSFSDLAGEMDDLKPISPGRRLADVPSKKGPGSTAVHSQSASEGGGDLLFPDPDQKLLARRSYVRGHEFKRLRQGRVPIDLSIDLHGQNREAARQRILSELLAAAQAGARCVLIVHGRGSHSEDGRARLREALPGWLAETGLASVVAAFAPARAADGGRGAVYVLLR
jgi:DNA-nicking Smr family endonuclease